ncbi:hypothetical protein CA85_49090 [Allorhodopirellula solitaria]|uniref:Uncharacterized protein n=1 Tax=Allorhodopirellula solitaria TaxID=2527987 RepID=A0A5C5WXP2_9BACT|nr:hypothetical protein CA85_49090 [Allorhodopirellula solitaria]
MDAPKTGDMYRCAKCDLEIHVTKGCDCKDCRTDFQCCGQRLEKVTEPSVQN